MFFLMCNYVHCLSSALGNPLWFLLFIRGISRLLPHEKAQWAAESWITSLSYWLICSSLELCRGESTVGVFDVAVIFAALRTPLPAPYSVLALSESCFGAGMSQTPLAGSRLVGRARRSLAVRLVSRRLLVFWSGSDSLFSQDLVFIFACPTSLLPVCFVCMFICKFIWVHCTYTYIVTCQNSVNPRQLFLYPVTSSSALAVKQPAEISYLIWGFHCTDHASLKMILWWKFLEKIARFVGLLYTLMGDLFLYLPVLDF